MRVITILCFLFPLLLWSQVPEIVVGDKAERALSATESSQTVENRPDGYIGFHLMNAQPQGEFGESYREAWGFDVEGFSNEIALPGIVALQIGGRLDYLHAGRHLGNVIVDFPPNATAESRINNAQMGLVGVARLITPDARFRFYTEASAGVRHFTSYESLELVGNYLGIDDEDDQIENNIARSFNPQVGVGAGIQARLARNVYLDFRTEYVLAGNPTYVDLDNISQTDKGLEFQTLRAPAQSFNFSIGLSFRVFDNDCGESTSCDCCCRGSRWGW